MSIRQFLIDKLLQGKDPYLSFPKEQWHGAWYGDPAAKNPILKTAINQSKPGLIIEVGSFVGESTLFMAEHIRTLQNDSCILCVDTWLGGFDHWTRVPEKLELVHGRPSLYFQFLFNVIERHCEGFIVPFALDSMNASRLLLHFDIKAKMVFIDGSHELGDVLRDLEAYWKLLLPGGVMVVDDTNGGFPGVTNDLNTFVVNNHLTTHQEGEKTMLVKI